MPYFEISIEFAMGSGEGWASLVTQSIKNQPAMQETQVQSLGWEDLLEKGMATPSSILAWRIPWIWVIYTECGYISIYSSLLLGY